MKPKIKTKFGTALLNKNDGYYYIKSNEHGNYDKLFHRLIWEDFYGFKIPKNFIIHHKNGLKHDNCILNLQLMNETDHKKLHMSGANHPFYHKTHSGNTYRKFSELRNTTGYFRVTKQPCKRCKNGFIYAYKYYVDGKQKAIVSVKLKELKRKVLAKGLVWEKIGDAIEV